MKSKITNFLETFPMLSREEVELIAEKLNYKVFAKGEILIHEGVVPKACFFLLTGCVRQFQLQDGEEKTVEFYTERNGAITSQDYSDKTPSKYTLVCVEESMLLVGDPVKDQEMLEQFPILQRITMLMMERAWLKEKENFASFITSSPEERYKNFLEQRPDLLNRVPQHQIASYLGMKPESLSRIRKRISIAS